MKKPHMPDHWNYRVIEFNDAESGEIWRGIFEVHYAKGKPIAYSAQPATVVADGGAELLWVIDRMREAMGKEKLTPRDFGLTEKEGAAMEGDGGSVGLVPEQVIIDLTARAERAEAALRPFASAAGLWDGADGVKDTNGTVQPSVVVRDLREAREVLRRAGKFDE